MVKNTETMLHCEECNKWQLVFSKKKLNKRKQESLNKLLETISYHVDFFLVSSSFCPLPVFFPEKVILIEALVKQDIIICTLKGPGEKICGVDRKGTT